jgi:hypothetical protein
LQLGTQVGYCVLRNRTMCGFLQERYLGMSGRCLRMAHTLSVLSYEAQAPLKLRGSKLTEDRACESVISFLQVGVRLPPPCSSTLILLCCYSIPGRHCHRCARRPPCGSARRVTGDKKVP